MKYSRRHFGKLALSSVPVAAGLGGFLADRTMAQTRSGSTVDGIRLGTISFSFKELKKTVGQPQWPEVLADTQQCGLSNLEIEIAKVEPIQTLAMGGGGHRPAPRPEAPAAVASPYGTPCVALPGAPRPAPRPPAPPMTPEEQAAAQEAQKQAREATRQFRVTTPASYYTNIKDHAKGMGIYINAYTCGWGDDYTDAEIDAVFQAAKALGAAAINSSTTLEMAQRLAPFADKHQFPVAFHGHLFGLFSNTDDYASTLALSKYFRVNLDIGHFTAACGDAVAFIKLNHDKLPSIHVKDYKMHAGPSMPWGQGDTPVKPVMQLLKSLHYPGVVTVEYDYPIPPGSNSILEVRKCVQYLKDSLA